jgi:uncharacterized protein
VARIGLIADTHDAVVAWEQIKEKVTQAFGGVDLIVHCGDLTTLAILDGLAEIAPVLAVRSPNDPPADGVRLFDAPHRIECGGAAIAIVNALGDESYDDASVVLCGGTHSAKIERRGSQLVVDPGSPTLADTVSVAVLDVDEGRAEASIVQL